MYFGERCELVERWDDLQCHGLHLLQDSEQFCFGVDAVLLSDFATVLPNDRVVDLCSGNGIVPILLSGKTEAASIIGVELQQPAVDLAKKSIARNALAGRVSMIQGDLRKIAALLPENSCEVVTCNPPYVKAGCALQNPNHTLALARHELACTLDDCVRAAAHLLCPKGRVYFVHRPDRLADLLCTLRHHGIEPKTLRVVHAYVHRPPVLVLVESVLGGGAQLRIHPPLLIHNSDGSYTDEINRIYGRGES